MLHPSWKHHLVMLLLVASSTAQKLIRLPSRTECRTLASTKHCMTQEMQLYCNRECAEHHNREILEQNRIPSSPKATSFYQISALDARGNKVNFEQFRDKVVLVTNVASFCDRTTKHYDELNNLHAKFRDRGLEILAFPCNQFGNQEPYSDSNIHAFCKRLGVEFRVMSKIDVNGPGQHEVYRFLKERVELEGIEWNFGTYFLIKKGGRISSFNGASPLFLETFIEAAING